MEDKFLTVMSVVIASFVHQRVHCSSTVGNTHDIPNTYQNNQLTKAESSREVVFSKA